MLNIRRSPTPDASLALERVPRKAGQDNLAWLKAATGLDPGGVRLVLVGGTDALHFRLRVAQSHLRHDLTPSHWSHVALLLGDEVSEISLQPVTGFGFPTPTNGVQRGSLEAYADAARFPNVAVVELDVGVDEVRGALERFQTQRSVLDATELMLVWLAFCWGVGRAANPLLDGNGIPSAAMAEVVMGAAGYDLTPGLESRASCPEAIWQAAKWWHKFYEDQKRTPPICRWHVGHTLVGAAEAVEAVETRAVRKASRKRR